MPHFGLMNEGEMEPLDAALLRAKLHIRCGKRRLAEGKFPDAISTLYDAVHMAMRWTALTTEAIHQEIHKLGDTVLEDDAQLYELLLRHKKWPQSVDFYELKSVLDNCLDDDLTDFTPHSFEVQINTALTHLGVLPFDLSELPPEDPQTF